MDNQLPIRVVRPIRLTDKKFAHELYGRHPNQSNYSCVNKKPLDKLRSHGRIAPICAWADLLVAMETQPSGLCLDPG